MLGCLNERDANLSCPLKVPWSVHGRKWESAAGSDFGQSHCDPKCLRQSCPDRGVSRGTFLGHCCPRVFGRDINFHGRTHPWTNSSAALLSEDNSWGEKLDLKIGVQTPHQDKVPKMLLSQSPLLELALDLFPDIDGRSLSSSADIRASKFYFNTNNI